MTAHNDDNTRTYAVLTRDTQVGHYGIIERIGAGGMGEVYLAQDTELDRKVALKFLPPHLCRDEDCRKRFKREAQAAAKLSHPNIVTIHEVGEYNGRPYFVMEHVEGQSLKDCSSGKDLPVEQILELGIQISEGLHAAHEKGVTHRDIKPSNILIDSHGRAKIVDFGLASVVGSDQLTRTGSTLGTVGYMSPEQVSGAEVDQRSDLFSLGVVLYELITKRNPFKRDSEAATLKAVSEDTPEPVARFKSALPDGLQTIIDTALEKSVATRYQTASGIISDLKRLSRDLLQRTPDRETKPSVAVLPFANLSADPEQEYFCDGMAEEIINALTHVEGLRVVARTSCFAFKGQHADVREIGRRLNVGSVLEGSVRKAGRRLRITAQLINVSDGYHLWSERYDRDMEDVFAIQDEISLAIVQQLRVKLLRESRAALTKRYTAHPDAHQLYLKGRFFWGKRSRDSLEKSIEYFGRAIEIDPDYALAYAGMAAAYCDLPNFSTFPPGKAYRRAKQAVLKALEIDDELVEAHTTLAAILSDYEYDWAGSQKEFEQAIGLNPAYDTAHQWYAFLLIYQGRSDEAISEMRIAYQLDPLSLAVNRNFGVIYYLARRYDDALDMMNRTIEMDPDYTYAHYFKGLVYLGRSEFDLAVEALQKERELHGAVDTGVFLPLATAYARMGEAAKVSEIEAEVEKRMEREFVSPCAVAYLYFLLGRLDDGFRMIEKAYTDRDPFLRFVKVWPVEDAVRQDPRYHAFLKKMNLA